MGVIRVIHSFTTWLPQTQTWMFNQAKYLPKNIELHVVCDRTINLDQFDLPNLHVLSDSSLTRYYYEKGLNKFGVQARHTYLGDIAEEINAELIHSHFGHIGWKDLNTTRKRKRKHVVTFYGADLSLLPVQDKRWIKRYHELFKEADLFLCEGPHMASRLSQLGCPRDKILVHHLGVAIDKIPFKPRYWSGSQPFRVLIAASFREKKGITYAIRAIAKIKNIIKLELTIIGDSSSDKESKIEKELIIEELEKNRLCSKTRMLGFQSAQKLFDESFRHHVFVSPSITAKNGDTEGGAPVTIIEMMATGIPVVSTNHCDIPEVIDYKMHDWLVAERDSDELSNRLLWLINNPGAWQKILELGRKHVEKEFNATTQGIRLGMIYKSQIQK